MTSNLSPESEVVSNSEVSDIFAGLKSRERVILELRVFQNMSFAEIGEVQGMTEGNVRLVFHRLISKLRDRLAKEFGRL